MSLNRTRFYFMGADTVGFDYYHGMPIDYPSGAAEITATANTAANPDGVGVEMQRMTVPERPVNINGYIIALPSAPCRRQLERAFAPLAKGRLWAVTEGRWKFWLDCVSAGFAIEGAQKFPRFQVQLLAAYPYWQAEEARVVTVTAAGTRGQTAAEIITDVPALFTLRIAAAGGGASGLRLAAGGAWLGYGGDLADGEMLTVSADAAGRVSADVDGQSVVGLISGELKKLTAGAQVLTLTAQSNAGVLTATISYKEARAGV